MRQRYLLEGAITVGLVGVAIWSLSDVWSEERSVPESEFQPPAHDIDPGLFGNYVKSWHELTPLGYTMPRDPGNVDVHMIAFIELGCSGSKTFRDIVHSLDRQLDIRVAITYIMSYLPGVESSQDRATLGICAGEVEVLDTFLDEIYEHEYTDGFTDGSTIREHIRRQSSDFDRVAWDECIVSDRPRQLLDKVQHARQRLGVSWYPTILMDGWHYTGGINEEDLRQAILAASRS